MSVAMEGKIHSFSYKVSTIFSIQEMRGLGETSHRDRLIHLAAELAQFLFKTIHSLPKNSSYTIELQCTDQLPLGTLHFQLNCHEKGQPDGDIKSPDLLAEKTCPTQECKTVFGHTYYCVKTDGGLYRPSKTFGALVQDDQMIAVVTSKGALLITPDPKSDGINYIEYTHLFALKIDQMVRIAIPLLRVISCIYDQGIQPDRYVIKWNAGIPANSVKVFHTRLEGLPKQLL